MSRGNTSVFLPSRSAIVVWHMDTVMAVAQLAATPILQTIRGVVLSNLRSEDRSGACIGAFVGNANSLPSSVRNVSIRTTRYRKNYSCCAFSGTTADDASARHVKSALMAALEGLNRGIFGVSSQKKAEIEDLLKSLEELNPCPRPAEDLDTVKGEWRLLYSTISVLGVKRTKLGLRDFVSLGEFLQIIDVEQKRAINKIAFNVAGLGMLKGALTIEAAYSVTSPTRVDIQFETSSISPERLFSLFKKNYDLLLGIFNPEGWLEITYVDDKLRVGRDDKGNVFLLERT